MNRYQQLDIAAAGKKYYTVSIPAKLDSEIVPFYYIASAGDRLDMLANRFYKTPSKWWVIAQANNLANGSMSVPAGRKLFIPNI